MIPGADMPARTFFDDAHLETATRSRFFPVSYVSYVSTMADEVFRLWIMMMHELSKRGVGLQLGDGLRHETR